MAEGIVLWQPENAGGQSISVSVETDKRPSADRYGDWSRSVFEGGWLTYGCLVYGNEEPDEWFHQNIEWPRPPRK